MDVVDEALFGSSPCIPVPDRLRYELAKSRGSGYFPISKGDYNPNVRHVGMDDDAVRPEQYASHGGDRESPLHHQEV